MSDLSNSALPDDITHPTGLARVLLETALTGIMVLRPCYAENSDTIVDFAYVSLNSAAQRQVRLPECPSESLLTLFPSSQEEGIFAFYCEAFRSGEVARWERMYQQDGLDGYFLIVAQRYEQVLVVNFTDSNDRPRTAVEEALRESQAREKAARAEAERQRGELERVFEQAPAAIAVYRGPNYTIELANSTVARLWGRTQDQLIGKGLFEALPEVAGMGYEELLDGVMATGVPHVAHAMEAQHDRNGQRETVYWDFVYVPMYAAEGHINGAMVVANEVTQQVRARQKVEQLNQELEARVGERTRQLTEQQTLLRQILSNVPAYIATLTGPEHRFTFFNKSYRQLSADRVELSLRLEEVLPESVAQGFVDILDQVYTTGIPYIGQEVPVSLYNAASGQQELQYLNFVYEPLTDKQGHTVSILVFAVDVTEQVLARQQTEAAQQQVQQLNEELQVTNEELLESNKQLQRINTDLDTFVYASSHDLKAPIANIEGLLNALREYLPTEEQEPMVPRLVGMMDNSITRFQKTVGHLTEVSRLQATRQLEQPETLHLAAILEEVRLDLLPLLESSRADLRIEVDNCPSIHFSEKSMRSVFFNLLSNAIKYRAPDRDPRVQIRAQCLPTRLVIEVQDNGLGLSEAQQVQLFTMFRRLHTHVEGSGVGLYLIKRTVENAGGNITVDSQLGVGSTFTVTLPRRA
ncbi:PAS domain-containing sensor histidine kinase [Hymenobacter aerilatus]|uniref:histidine kinase n=1 Tax=Hymenobacter aerilatus TaxID=2932251 RepID=A0A8T9T2B6_9BACT|nr:PAS domain-containing protein [Hymenobacter aerilatus]UOR06710.1 PAS domain-containing sensor histidine kinase [Hymenobacter aerilatus]